MPDAAASPTPFSAAPQRTYGFGWMARLGYEYAVFYFLLAIFATSSLILSLTCLVLYALLPRRIGEPLGQFLIMAGCRYFVWLMRTSGMVKCDLVALDALRDERSLIIAANHPSLLDVVLIMSRLPHVVCAAKTILLKNPLFGGSARLAGFIRNDAPMCLVKTGIRQLRAGYQLLIFPEGTRTSSGRVDAFKGGFALIAKRVGAPVQTVFIDDNSRFLGKGWPWFRKPDFPLVYRIRLGNTLTVAGDHRAFVAGLHDYYRHELGDGNP